MELFERNAIMNSDRQPFHFLDHQTKPMKKYLIPENLDLSQFTYPERTAKFLDMLIRRRFLSNLRSNRTFWKRKHHVFYSDRWVSIPSLTLKKNIHDNYLPIFEELRNQGIVERSVFSRERHEAYGYRFTEDYRNALLKPVSFRPKNQEWYDNWLQERREKERVGVEGRDDVKVGYLMALDCLNMITLECNQDDVVRIMRRIHSQEERKRNQEQQKPIGKRSKRKQPYEHAIAAVHKCNNVLFKVHEIVEGKEERYVPFYCIDDYGRFHYYLTSLPKSLRPFVRLNGNRVTSYDITSSQCIFFALAVREEARSRDGINFHFILNEIDRVRPKFFFDKETFLHEEMIALGKESPEQVSFDLRRRFRKRQLDDEIEMLFEILSDDFYEFMMIRCGARWESDKEFQRKRESFKSDFFEFLYGPNRRRGKIFKAFQNTFPYITLVLWKMKDLGGMYRRFDELHHGGMEPKDAWKHLKKEAKREKKWYIGLPLRMQETEADFMFNRIAPKIGRSFLPIHDCILVEKTERRNVKNIEILLRDEFRKMDVTADIKSKDW